MGQKKVQRTQEVMTKAALVPTDFDYDGCKVFLAVPADRGVLPPVMAQEFSRTTREMFERAQEPTPRDMFEATLNIQAGIMGE
jgi:hypothetical protein